MPDVLRVVVLSAAHGHANGYVRRLASTPDVAVWLHDLDASRDEGRPRGAGLAAVLGVPHLDTMDDVWAARPQAAVVCAENAGHFELVRAALEHGCHVLSEKPLTLDPDEADDLVRLAAASGLRLGVAHPVRHAPAYLRLRELVRQGVLGEVLSIVGTNNGMLPRDAGWFTDPDLAGGGALVDHVVHCADLIDGLVGVAPKTVRAVGNRILHQTPPTPVETGGLVTLGYPCGLIATIDCSWSQPPNAATWGGLTLDVFGTQGRVVIDPFGPHVGGTLAGGPAHLSFGVDLDDAMLADFIDAIRTGRDPAADGAAGARCTAIVAAALRSAAGGGSVEHLD